MQKVGVYIMDYTYATNRQEMNRIDKLNELRNISTYWDEVRKLTRNVKSDIAIKRWQHLAEVRFEEIKQETLQHYYNSYKILSMELGGDTMSFVSNWIKGNGELPIYDMSGDNRQLASHIKGLYTVLKSYGLVS